MCSEVLLFVRGHVCNSDSNTKRANYVKAAATVLGNNTAPKKKKKKLNKMTKSLNRANKRSMSVRINTEQKGLICALMMAINLPD